MVGYLAYWQSEFVVELNACWPAWQMMMKYETDLETFRHGIIRERAREEEKTSSLEGGEI